MDKNTAIVSLAGIIAGTIIVGFLLQTIVSVWKHRHRASVAPGSLGQIDERLDRIEHAIDAMAVEVERISEGQRFTTRLLSDRGEQEPARLRQG